MSWLVTFGRTSDNSERRIAFVICKEQSFAKILMNSADWEKPNDPNRDPFNKALYPEDLSANQLFGVLTANLQLHFEEVSEFTTEDAAKRLVETVIGKRSIQNRPKPSKDSDSTYISIAQKFRELADLFEMFEKTQNENINGLHLQISELEDEFAQMASKLKLEAPAAKSRANKAGPKSSGQAPAKPATKKPGINSKGKSSEKK